MVDKTLAVGAPPVHWRTVEAIEIGSIGGVDEFRIEQRGIAAWYAIALTPSFLVDNTVGPFATSADGRAYAEGYLRQRVRPPIR